MFELTVLDYCKAQGISTMPTLASNFAGSREPTSLGLDQGAASIKR